MADTSHKLKTPLTAVLANTGLVLSHPEDMVAAQPKWLEYTHDETEQMRRSVDDLLFLARSDAARQPAARVETAISEAALGCLLPFESVAFETDVVLEHRITPDLSLRGDEGQLRRLVMTLLDNAVKYAGSGSTVTFTLERHQERLRLTVHNTGESIPPERLPHLFERFYRADAARNRSRGGYGLELAIAGSIVESHHGRLTITSTAAAGTTLTALLPRRWRFCLSERRGCCKMGLLWEKSKRRNQFMSVTVGNKGHAACAINDQNTAATVGGGLLSVFTTPQVIALMENAVVGATQASLEEGQDAVGTRLDVGHDSATPVEMQVWAEAEVTAVDGRKLAFTVTAYDETSPTGKGIHERFIIRNDESLAKVQGKRKGN